MDQNNFFKEFYKRLREAASDEDEWFRNLDNELNKFYSDYKKEKSKKEDEEWIKNVEKDVSSTYNAMKSNERVIKKNDPTNKTYSLFEAIFGYAPEEDELDEEKKEFVEFYNVYFAMNGGETYPLVIQFDPKSNEINNLIKKASSEPSHFMFNYEKMQCFDYYNTDDPIYKLFLELAKDFSIIPSEEFPAKIYKLPVDVFTLKEERSKGVDVRKKYSKFGSIMYIKDFYNKADHTDFIHIPKYDVSSTVFDNDLIMVFNSIFKKYGIIGKDDFYIDEIHKTVDFDKFPETIKSMKDIFEIAQISYDELSKLEAFKKKFKTFGVYVPIFTEVFSQSPTPNRGAIYKSGDEMLSPSNFTKYPFQVFIGDIDDATPVDNIYFYR